MSNTGAAIMAEGDTATMTALASSYNQKIRPLLDVVDRLRHLNVMQEGIELPTIVVVGDQSSGKSSVLESLAGISLPRGLGICTRVPLIMRLQSQHSLLEPQLQLEYNGKVVQTTESDVTSAINAATDEIAGNSKGISDTPLTLTVKKQGVADLTMVDLPGITRVPVRGQPDNIYEQISAIIMKYIKPKQSVILNVLSASVDFPTCESIRMSQMVDKSGERTLAVVTKPDMSPEGLLEKVTADDVHIGLGYVCVRNRIGDESYEEAREEETRLFKDYSHLSKIDKSMVGVRVLANKLMEIQAASIGRNLPDIVKKINDKLHRNLTELEQLPQNLKSLADAMRAFMRIVSMAKESLRNLLIRGDFDEFADDVDMHATARLAEMQSSYSKRLPSKCPTDDHMFLMDEIRVLQETKGIGLPNFLPRTAFCTILKKKVKAIIDVPREYVSEVWVYIEDVLIRVLLLHSDNFPQLQSSLKSAAHTLIEKMKSRSNPVVKEMIEMEMTSDYTYNPDYMKTWCQLMANRDEFMAVVEDCNKQPKVEIEGFGVVEIGHLRQHVGLAEQAFDMRMRLTAYWRCIFLRLVDTLSLHVLYSIKCLVENELEEEVQNQIVGPDVNGLQRMLEESPSTAGKRQRLKKSIKLLKDSKEVVAKIMDRIIANDD